MVPYGTIENFELCFRVVFRRNYLKFTNFFSVFHLLKLCFELSFNLRKLKNPNSKKISLKHFCSDLNVDYGVFEWCFSNLAPVLSFSDDFFIENGVYQLCF